MSQSDHSYTDEQLLALLRSSPRKGFEALFRTYYQEVCRHVYYYLPEQAVVEDIAQELFAELWRKRKTLIINASPGAFLRRMAISRTLNYIRDNKKQLFANEDKLPDIVSNSPLPQEVMSARELEEAITKGVDTLPLRCRQVFMLSRFEGLTNKQISAELEISVKTVENQMTKALRVLRDIVDRYDDGIGGSD